MSCFCSYRAAVTNWHLATTVYSLLTVVSGGCYCSRTWKKKRVYEGVFDGVQWVSMLFSILVKMLQIEYLKAAKWCTGNSVTTGNWLLARHPLPWSLWGHFHWLGHTVTGSYSWYAESGVREECVRQSSVQHGWSYMGKWDHACPLSAAAWLTRLQWWSLFWQPVWKVMSVQLRLHSLGTSRWCPLPAHIATWTVACYLLARCCYFCLHREQSFLASSILAYWGAPFLVWD